MSDQGQHLESGPMSSQPGSRPREENQPDRQTTGKSLFCSSCKLIDYLNFCLIVAFTAASRRTDRSTEAKRESAEKASKKYSEGK